MKGSQICEIEEAIGLLEQAAEKLYYIRNGYSNYGRDLYEIAQEIRTQVDQEELE